jgi:Fur family transcriptional regulator, peroxide stress response regulator
VRNLAVLVRTFHERGLRVTPRRERLFCILQEGWGRSTIEALYEVARREMPTISLKTVYRTVYTLAELGEVQILALGTGRFRVEPTVEHSLHHLVHAGCG